MSTPPELERALAHASDYLAQLAKTPVGKAFDPDVVRAAFERPLTDTGRPGAEVIDELVAAASTGLLHSASPRFFGWVIGGGLPVGIAADWLATTWDQNAAAYACSPAAAAAEDAAATWIKQLLGLPAEASYAFVTGCQLAHVTGLLAARHRLLKDRGFDVERDGLAGAPAIRVLAGERHETLVRAVRYVGLGTNAIVDLARDDQSTIDVEALAVELRRRADQPTIVALAAGELNRGTFDTFEPICELAHRHGAWVHVDGAFGLWAGASPRFRHLVAGVEHADSWATDAHKWLNVPYDCGLAFVRDRAAHQAAISIPAAYKLEVAGARDEFDWGPEWSRRARGFSVWATLRHLGRSGVAQLVDNCCDRAADLVSQLGELPNAEVLAAPVVNQGLIRFRDPGPAGDHDHFTATVIDAIVADGAAWFGPTTWRGMRVMRVSVSNWRTTSADIDQAVAGVRRALEATR